MSQVTVYSCDCCKAEFREAPHPTQGKESEITLSGVGPIDQPMGRTLHYRWKDLCPTCLSQIRDALLKMVEARKGRLDITVNDSTKSPTTEQIERAKQEGIQEERERTDKKIEKATKAATTRERERLEGVIHGEIASQKTIIDNGNDEPVTRESVVELLRRIDQIVKTGQGENPI